MKSLVAVFLLLACASGAGALPRTNWNDVERFAITYLSRQFSSSEPNTALMISEISGVWQRTDLSGPPIMVRLQAAYLVQFIANERKHVLDDSTLRQMADLILDDLSSSHPRAMEVLMELPVAFAPTDLERIVWAVGLHEGRFRHDKLFFLINRAEKDADFVARLKGASSGPSSFWKEIELQILSNIEKFTQHIENESAKKTSPSRRYREDAIRLFERMRKIDPKIEDRVFAPVTARQKQLGTEGVAATVTSIPRWLENLLNGLLKSEDSSSHTWALELLANHFPLLSPAELQILWNQSQKMELEPGTREKLTALFATQVKTRMGEVLERLTEMNGATQPAFMVGCLNLLAAIKSGNEPAAAHNP